MSIARGPWSDAMAWRSFYSHQIPFPERRILHNWFSEFSANPAENLSICRRCSPFQTISENHQARTLGVLANRRRNAVYNSRRCGCSSVVERLLPKQDIVGSSPITRSRSPICGPSGPIGTARSKIWRCFYVLSKSNKGSTISCLPRAP